MDDPCGESSGIISIQWNTQGSTNYIGGDCTKSTRVDKVSEFVPGPVTGTVSIVSYAFGKGSDKWLGVRCASKVQVNQSHLIKYDGSRGKEGYHVIPTANHSAQITGNVPDGVTMTSDCYTTSYSSQLMAGSVPVSTKMDTSIGHGLMYSGVPISVSFPEMDAYKILGKEFLCYMSGFAMDIDYPSSPAKATYTWQFILDCD